MPALLADQLGNCGADVSDGEGTVDGTQFDGGFGHPKDGAGLFVLRDRCSAALVRALRA